MENIPSPEEMQAKRQQELEMEERKRVILDQVLDPGARARLTRLGLTRAEKCKSIEEKLVMLATSGQLKAQITEAQLISMLEGEGKQTTSKIVIKRRDYGMDDDDDDDDNDI
mmetsp:Transcript_27446/g.27669  ORF Transcript_27446/g.27669 Transcript_27446/m.27669 type:complete len:112 (-) Transcript_27446:139-474(-)|eukprot:CAMPEP_0182428786 /NCGR_PEP_ID=MMETSP1167-20130531/23617_1 /TAXON_ID=2988 /ORGANISM="Mallomonas Sp, Strain CCMP3275" /LENGTH=111 /DNA_ID=CAMNT_0024611885 /DNA_START=199 /DNA_END=534 /DNA_ORIENTATION=-